MLEGWCKVDHHSTEYFIIIRFIKPNTDIKVQTLIDLSGLFINLSELNENIIDILGKYLEYINNQMDMIDNIECKKQEYKDNFFNTNSSKDNTTYNESWFIKIYVNQQ